MRVDIKIGDKILHKPSGKVGTYVEHLNEGDGYMMLPDDGGHIICGKYEDFQKEAGDE